jgi:hypothetical protein
MRKIVTSPTHSPLPYRSMDFCAHFDGEEEAGGYGYGATPEEAVADFIDNHADDPDAEAMITAPAKTVAESVNLLAEMNARGLKPTCDEAGNWRYADAAAIDGRARTMETQFRELCERYDLTCAGTLFQHNHGDYLTVYLHWGAGDAARCVSGGGKTFDDALVVALASLSVQRASDDAARAAVEGGKLEEVAA